MIKIVVALIVISIIVIILRSKKKKTFKIADIEMMEVFITDPNITIVDTRSKLFAEAYHIEGSINIPHLEFDKYKHLLPNDKTAPIVFYCRDTKCQLSGKSAIKAIAEGHVDTYVFEQGVEGWYKHKGYSTPEIDILNEMAISKDNFVTFYKTHKNSILLVDVNDMTIYQEGHLKSAVSIPLGHIPGHIDRIPRNKTILLYCETGIKSAEAASFLLETETFKPENIRFLNASVSFTPEGKTEFSEPEE